MDGRPGDGDRGQPPWESGTPLGTGGRERDTGYGPATGSSVPRLRPLSVGEVLDGMFRLLVRHWRAYLLALGAILVPVSILTSYLGYETGGRTGLLEQFGNPAASEALLAGGVNVGALVGLFGVGLANALLVTPLVNGTACRIAATAHEGGDPQPGAALKAAVAHYPALVGANLLVLLLPFVAIAPAAAMIAFAALAESVALAIGGVVVLLLGLVGVLALYTLFSLAYAVIVVEGAGPVGALRRSTRLVRARFWPIVGTLLLAFILAGIVAAVLSIPFSIPGSVIGGATGLVLTTAGSTLASVLSAPLTANAQTLLYYDARVRREGLDLELFAQRTGGVPPEWLGGSAG